MSLDDRLPWCGPMTENGEKKILISACLAGQACAYDGRDRLDARSKAIVESGRGLAVCPEQLGGLPTPREPAEIVGGAGREVLERRARVLSASGSDVTDAFLSGARQALAIALAQGCRQAILKSRSPSCGRGAVHDGSFSGRLRPGDGVTAALLKEHGIEIISEEEL